MKDPLPQDIDELLNELSKVKKVITTRDLYPQIAALERDNGHLSPGYSVLVVLVMLSLLCLELKLVATHTAQTNHDNLSEFLQKNIFYLTYE
jgi:hypothetical protein